MSEPLLRAEDLQTYLGDSHIIQGVSLDVHEGKVVALLGDRKSTRLNSSHRT